MNKAKIVELLDDGDCEQLADIAVGLLDENGELKGKNELLIQTIEALRKRVEWRDVKKEKPQVADWYTVRVSGLTMHTSYLFYNPMTDIWSDWQGDQWTVTHWMPLPQPPEER